MKLDENEMNLGLICSSQLCTYFGFVFREGGGGGGGWEGA